ncbi:hypothetical protein EFK68_03525 [Pseudomonas aeruginosa]|uniref:hypothetical protein n=1 Tax=Pseudomonas aeruginosa TaxID=287 RepID=UPI000F6B2CE5|nr:hypothetical protein [Pseudomonas aeruginosa]EKF7416823.1 hypothetical protein [Pseudomonas aeruginosa]RNF58460.1 hypothetical protein EFK68_03525 [Pseudomonas aeruginosa]CAI9794831.1 MFS transporter [Pseudomonas aeruginosa]CAI9912220.1 MFS transporter [Pseudomonas aeruginosa]HBO1619477.1 hypothetical protein [Pseudomonas aeruginosa]
MKKNTAYGLGVYGFGVLAMAQMAPALLGDESLGGWRFAVLTVTVFATFFCAYKTFSARHESSDTPS